MQNTTMSLEEIRAIAAAKRAEKLAAKLIQAEIEMLENEQLQDSLAEQDFVDSQLAKLNGYVETLRNLYTLIPTVNSKGATRKAPTTRLFGQGEALDSLTQLCSLHQYAPKAHELHIETLVPKLSTTLVERFLNSIGRATYLGRDGVIVEEILPNFSELQTSAALLLSQLGILLDTKTMSEQKLVESFIKAKSTAEAELAKQKTMANEDETMALFTMEE